MKIAVTGGKGGTGKSMAATSLAIELSKRKKVTLVDVDAECPNDHLLLDIKRKKEKNVYQTIPKFDMEKCKGCGKCAKVCKQEAIVFVEGRKPAFVKDLCIGCQACIYICPANAITPTQKIIGTISIGKKYDVNLISGELKIGELASGEVVSEVRAYADKRYEDNEKNEKENQAMIIDSAAGIGCPVIASLIGTDHIVAVTEPTPSALHDLKRVIYLAEHFGIKRSIIINKHDLEENFCKEIEKFAKQKNINIIGRIPYHKNFLEANLKMKPVVEIEPKYSKIFKEIIEKIEKEVYNPKI